MILWYKGEGGSELLRSIYVVNIPLRPESVAYQLERQSNINNVFAFKESREGTLPGFTKID